MSILAKVYKWIPVRNLAIGPNSLLLTWNSYRFSRDFSIAGFVFHPIWWIQECLPVAMYLCNPFKSNNTSSSCFSLSFCVIPVCVKQMACRRNECFLSTISMAARQRYNSRSATSLSGSCYSCTGRILLPAHLSAGNFYTFYLGRDSWKMFEKIRDRNIRTTKECVCVTVFFVND